MAHAPYASVPTKVPEEMKGGIDLPEVVTNQPGVTSPSNVYPGYDQQHVGYDQPAPAYSGYPPYNPPHPSYPIVTAPTTTVVVNQTVGNLQTGPRIWSSGLCSCFDDCGSCLCGTFCQICHAGQIASDLGESCCVPLCVPGGIVAMRTKLRTMHRIEGSIMDDGCMVQCCLPCVLCQMDRELKFVRATNPHSVI